MAPELSCAVTTTSSSFRLSSVSSKSNGPLPGTSTVRSSGTKPRQVTATACSPAGTPSAGSCRRHRPRPRVPAAAVRRRPSEPESGSHAPRRGLSRRHGAVPLRRTAKAPRTSIQQAAVSSSESIFSKVRQFHGPKPGTKSSETKSGSKYRKSGIPNSPSADLACRPATNIGKISRKCISVGKKTPAVRQKELPPLQKTGRRRARFRIRPFQKRPIQCSSPMP